MIADTEDDYESLDDDQIIARAFRRYLDNEIDWEEAEAEIIAEGVEIWGVLSFLSHFQDAFPAQFAQLISKLAE